MSGSAKQIHAWALRHQSEILSISRELHACPELRFEEHQAQKLLTGSLRDSGWEVEYPVAALPTAFVARLPGQTGHPVVALLAEYDALPDIGHGCGHNIIAAMSVGAAWIVQEALRESPLPGGSGQVWLIGTPGEEGGGGKVLMADAGVFAGVDAALMLHPASDDDPAPAMRAREGVDIYFQGRSAHAASAPEQGIDALQAGVSFLGLLNAIRPSLRPDANLYSIVLEGGSSPNVIVDRCHIRMQARADTSTHLQGVLERVLECARAAASALRAEFTWERFVPPYKELASDPKLVGYLAEGFRAVGRTPVHGRGPHGSTDAGNLSHILPTAHGSVALTPVPGHSLAFTAAAGSEAGDRTAMDGAETLAYAVLRRLGAIHPDPSESPSLDQA